MACCLALPFTARGATANEVWLRVDTRSATLTVMKGDKAQTVFGNIAIGRYGKTYFKREGDEKTPLGRFTIAWIPHKSRFHRFLGLDYPDMQRADRALMDGDITEAQWQAIRRAHQGRKASAAEHPAWWVYRHPWDGRRRSRDTRPVQLDRRLYRIDQRPD